MNNKYLLIIAGVALILSAFGVKEVKEQVLGSVQDGQGYYSTTTVDSTWPSATAFKRLKTGRGILGSIVVGSTSAATASYPSLKCYDSSVSTSTASSTIATIASAAAGATYTFDAAFNAGLYCEAPVGFNGGYTITWK